MKTSVVNESVFIFGTRAYTPILCVKTHETTINKGVLLLCIRTPRHPACSIVSWSRFQKEGEIRFVVFTIVNALTRFKCSGGLSYLYFHTRFFHILQF